MDNKEEWSFSDIRNFSSTSLEKVILDILYRNGNTKIYDIIELIPNKVFKKINSPEEVRESLNYLVEQKVIVKDDCWYGLTFDTMFQLRKKEVMKTK